MPGDAWPGKRSSSATEIASQARQMIFLPSPSVTHSLFDSVYDDAITTNHAAARVKQRWGSFSLRRP